MKPSLIADAQARRAKTLRIDESWAAPQQAPCPEDDKFARKAEVISIFERCQDLYGVSRHGFIVLWDHKYSTAYGYLDKDEKRYPKQRSVRTARALENYLRVMAEFDAEINAAKGHKVA